MLEPPDENLRRQARRPSRCTSNWNDTVWEWTGGPPAKGRHNNQIRWDFRMADGSRFDEPQWATWRQAMKTAVWSLDADPSAARKPTRIGSFRLFYTYLRTLVQWMHDNGYQRLNQLTRTSQRAFMRDIGKRKGRGSPEATLKTSTLAQYQNMLQVLFLQGQRYPELAIAEPRPQDAIKLSHANPDRRSIPKTPDAIATALVGGAIQLLGPPAENIIDVRDRMLELYSEVEHTLGTTWQATAHVRKEFQAHPPGWKRCRNEHWYTGPVDNPHDVQRLVSRLCDAAAIVLSYLVGMRISEILALETGCVTKQPKPDGGGEYILIKGIIYKTAPSEHGQEHEWVGPPIAERAIEVLERISRPLRERTGKHNLWLIQQSKGLRVGTAPISVLTSHTMGLRWENKFAPFIGLPLHEGARWHLSTHQGRKTFADFMAKQDRSGLEALKDQLGHRSIVMTDIAYSPRDADMAELIGEAGMREKARTLAEVLIAPDLAGKKGKEIANREALAVSRPANHRWSAGIRRAAHPRHRRTHRNLQLRSVLLRREAHSMPRGRARAEQRAAYPKHVLHMQKLRRRTETPSRVEGAETPKRTRPR